MKIALLGFGTVGKGAYDAANRAGIEVRRVLVRSPRIGMEDIVTSDFSDILKDPEIDAVAEAMGGLHPAFEYAMATMEAKKHFVTANKALVCEYYKELTRAAEANGVQLRSTAAVGGGIQWLPNLRRACRCDEILEFYGIMNGTTNFMLTGMGAGKTYQEALSEAQIRGYAEADPTADVMGYDARRKCALSANTAFDALVNEEDVLCEGIAEISQEFIGRLCDTVGAGTVKLIASAGYDRGGIYAAVQPEYIPAGALFYGVDGCYNMISYRGKNIGVQSYYGSGAGCGPTGSGLIQDIMDIIEGGGNRLKVPKNNTTVDNSKKRRYYVEIDGRGELTGPVTIKDMFSRVGAEREKGRRAAFAALPDEVDE